MKKIVFGITNLGFGGAERVLVDICNKLKAKYEITIFTLYPNGEFESQLDSHIQIISLYDKEYFKMNKLSKMKISMQMINANSRKKIYNKYLKDNYDIEIAFLEGPITWIFGEKGKSRKIAWIHNDIKSVFGHGQKASLKQRINAKSYNKYDDLVFVSQDNLNKFNAFFPNNKVNKQVIYNYIDYDLVNKKALAFKADEVKSNYPTFVQVSRLVEQKAVDRLVDVHAKLIKAGYKHTIYVIGDGKLRASIQNKITKLNLNATFVLLGKKENPYPYIKKADYFILTSYYEGYPMVLLEAKALNKYIMITDSAARETLTNYNNKLIVNNNEEGIFNGLKDLIENKRKVVKTDEEANNEALEKVIKVIEGE